jgi:ABC-type uncharacterized transport system auxiliary subunit
MRITRTLAAIATAALLAGCGGGGAGSSSMPNGAQQPSPQAPAQTVRTARVSFTIAIPAATATSSAQNPAYISSSTQSARSP